MIKVDLHTHSIISPDGGISSDQYEELLADKILDCIAITDHNMITFAQMMHKKLGSKIIIGEEITTKDGEMIGLFLEKLVQPGMTAEQTAKAIRDQGGLVYIPHPFEVFRKGIKEKVLSKIIDMIDIIETFNGRGRLRGKAKEAQTFANQHDLVAAASSDAHGFYGIGKTFSIIESMPNEHSLKNLLQKSTLQKQYAPLFSYLYPRLNVIKNKLTVYG